MRRHSRFNTRTRDMQVPLTAALKSTLALGLMLLLAWPLSAHACPCSELSIEGACARPRGVVLTGRVLSVRPRGGVWEVRMRVIRTHRGPRPGSSFVFETGRVPGAMAISSCDGPPPPPVGAWVRIALATPDHATACDVIERLPDARTARLAPCHAPDGRD